MKEEIAKILKKKTHIKESQQKFTKSRDQQ